MQIYMDRLPMKPVLQAYVGIDSAETVAWVEGVWFTILTCSNIKIYHDRVGLGF
jgi:hypothetical protein